jgi:hypothetical protein
MYGLWAVPTLLRATASVANSTFYTTNDYPMTQFMLVIGIQPQDANIVCRSIDEAAEFLKKLAHQLFTDRQMESCWYPEGLNGESVHDLLKQSRTHMMEGRDIKDTLIGQLLIKAFRSCHETLLWYSHDFDNLPEFTNIEMAMNEISSELIELSGEIYLKFRGDVSLTS